jgi:hypothetical protein
VVSRRISRADSFTVRDLDGETLSRLDTRLKPLVFVARPVTRGFDIAA